MNIKYAIFVILIIILAGCENNNGTSTVSTKEPIEHTEEATTQPTATPESQVMDMSESLYYAIQELLETDEELTLEQLEELEELNFHNLKDTELTSIEGIRYCKNLKSLAFSNVSNISPVGELSNLESLSISDYTTGGEALAGLVNLKKLFFGKKDTNDLQYLKNPEMIEEFRCRTDIDTENLPSFDNLKILKLSKSRDNPEQGPLNVLQFFSKIDSIEELCLNDFDIDIKDIINYKALKKLKTQNYGYSLINFDLLAEFNDFEELIVIDIVLEEKVVEDIGEITNLKKLSLQACEISDISSLKDLENLEHLNLYGNPITNISVVSNFKNLKYFKIGYCFWYETPVLDISALKDLEFLEEVYLHYYAFSDDGEDLIAQLVARGVEVHR